MRTLIVMIVAVALLAPASAEAKPLRLVDSSSDTSSFPTPYVSSFISSPKKVLYRVTMEPAAPASGEIDVHCYRGRRDVALETPWSSSVSFQAPIAMTLANARDCDVSVDFTYDDTLQPGSVQLNLYAKSRKKRKRP